MKKSTIIRSAAALLALAAAAVAAGCDTDAYCVGGSCGEPTGDASGGDDGGESAEGGADGEDARTDVRTDVDTDVEGGGDVDGGDGGCDADTDTDPNNCGECGHRCDLPNAYNACEDGVCVVDRCLTTWWDNDPAEPGCEYYCIRRVTPGNCDESCVPDPAIPGGECDTACNHQDDDCNGVNEPVPPPADWENPGVDDCVDLERDRDNCGYCGVSCRYPNGIGACEPDPGDPGHGRCVLGGCEDGYWDLDGSDGSGCEYECGPTDGSAPPAETCNRLDDDCDGETDEGNPGGGAPCGSSEGECEEGITRCIDGTLECVGGTPAARELCDDLDNDCDTTTDEDPTDVGTACGTRTGWCEPGTWICNPGGARECDGDVEPRAETCNGIDDDCDGVVDDDVTDTFDCTNPLVCIEGTPLCDSGVWVCDGEVPGGLEVCNGIDDDCDTIVDNGYDLDDDVLNCGACGNVCSLAGAVEVCAAGSCDIASCETDRWDANGVAADGCEYSCVRVAPDYDTCNARDDDCDTLTDALDVADFAGTRPSIGTPDYFCNTVGACAGVTVACGPLGGTTQWRCDYPAAVRTDSGGTILPETSCDGVDEDCDGTTDESWPGVAHSAADPADPCSAGVGGCLRSGSYACTLLGTGQECSAAAGTPAPVELCNGIDDDCNGIVDDAVGAGRVIDDMAEVNRGGRHFWIYRYEASRPDATSFGGGVSGARTCSSPGVLPWTSVTWDEAAAACASTGKRLCTAAEWLEACSGGLGRVYPYGDTYGGTLCNGLDFDGVPGGADDDVLLPTGAALLSSCRSVDAVNDLSGNAREWTNDVRGDTGPPLSTPIVVTRGGGYDTPVAGLTCAFDISRATATTRLPTLGFRCCSDGPP